MPHRVAFFCQQCRDAHDLPTEIFDVQVWVDEDKVLIFIVQCEQCKNSEIFKTSVEELYNIFRSKEPKYDM